MSSTTYQIFVQFTNVLIYISSHTQGAETQRANGQHKLACLDNLCDRISVLNSGGVCGYSVWQSPLHHEWDSEG